MKGCFIRNKLLSAAIFLLIWWVLTLIYPPVVLPTIPSVLRALKDILQSPMMWMEIGRTFYRLFFGLLFGILSGVIIGFLCAANKTFRSIAESYIHLLQVIPPVSILILTILWLGYNGKPAIAISAIAVFPTMAITTCDAILNLDRSLLEMGKLFHFSRTKQLKTIIWPSIQPQVFSALKISVGSASKTVVMGEVLTTVTGIGGQIQNARLNIESEGIIAWTIIATILYLLYAKLTHFLFGEKKKTKKNQNAHSTEPSKIL